MADNILKKQLDCLSADSLKGIFTGLAKSAWGACAHIFGKVVVCVNDMKRDVFGDGLGGEATLAPVPFRTAHLRAHRVDRRVETRWRCGFV